MSEVSFSPVGFVLLDVAIKPLNSNKMEYVTYKVDSGANCTTISFAQLQKFGYDTEWVKSGKLLQGNARPIVASGAAVNDCYEVILPEIRIGEWVGYNWPVITSLSVPFSYLLGTNSMRFFNWHFDYENDVCRFDLIPGKRKLLFNQKEQSIHAVDEAKH